jgi:hypothetical protein
MTSVSSPKWTDDELLAELRDALQDELVDDAVIRAAREAFSWRMTDADIELFTLAADYSLEAGRGLSSPAGAGAQVRDGGGRGPQALVFQGERMSVQIEIDETGIVGQLIPPQPGQITLVTADGPQATTQADEVGCFLLPMPGSGPLRLDCQLGDYHFLTEWATA